MAPLRGRRGIGPRTHPHGLVCDRHRRCCACDWVAQGMRRACGMTSSCGKQALSRACVEAWSTSGQVFAKAIGIRRHGGCASTEAIWSCPAASSTWHTRTAAGQPGPQGDRRPPLEGNAGVSYRAGRQENELSCGWDARVTVSEGVGLASAWAKSGTDALGGDADLVYASDRWRRSTSRFTALPHSSRLSS